MRPAVPPPPAAPAPPVRTVAPPAPPGVDPLRAAVDWLAGTPVSMVLHIGAMDDDLLDAYARHRPARLVLIDGRPIAGPQAAARAGVRPGLTWRHDVLAAEKGPATWHAHTLPRLDGVLRPEGLLAHYPGAAATGTLAVEAVTLAEVLPDLLGTDGGEDATRLLVLDLPGLEAALLQGLPSRLLAAFDFVLYRGVRIVGHAGGQGARAALDHLRGRGWRIDRLDTDSEPLWPVRLLSLSAAMRDDPALDAEVLRLRERNGQLNAELARQTEQAERLRAERAQVAEQQRKLREELTEARQSAAQALKLSLLRDGDLRELQARHAELVAERDGLAAQLAELSARVQALHARLSDEPPTAD